MKSKKITLNKNDNKKLLNLSNLLLKRWIALRGNPQNSNIKKNDNKLSILNIV